MNRVSRIGNQVFRMARIIDIEHVVNNSMNSHSGRTTYKRLELYRDRWTTLGANTGISQLSEMLAPQALKHFEIFEKYDDKFLQEISHDISVARWKPGAILFEEGNYIDLAFYIVEGQVEVYVNKVQRGKKHTSHLNMQVGRKKRSGKGVMFLSVMDFNLPVHGRMRLGAGDILGEIGALSGWPQSVTARAISECVLVQIRLPALRRMRDEAPHLKEWTDKIYRERYLALELQQSPFFRNCHGDFLDALAQKVELISCRKNAAITQQGEPADALFIVRSGFVKLLEQIDGSEMAVSYLSKGMILGDIELLIEGIDTWQFSASSMERSELIKISYDHFIEIFESYPQLEQLLWKQAVARFKEAGYHKKNIDKAALVDVALEKGLLQGRSILVIDLEQCTRCDDCVRACAATHGGHPKFVREGDRYENLLITRACYHCHDPACIVGCPTGAIHRARPHGLVEIDSHLCIGCRTCERNCPYDAITMQHTGIEWPSNMVPEHLRGNERLLATKCDLCSQSENGPACVNNCPNGCAYRVGSLAEIQQLLVQE